MSTRGWGLANAEHVRRLFFLGKGDLEVSMPLASAMVDWISTYPIRSSGVDSHIRQVAYNSRRY